MSLLSSELDQIRFELGWNGLNVGAEPYIGVAAIFDRVVAPYLRSGLITTSSTAIAAAAATQRTIVVAAASGLDTQGDPVSIHAGDILVVDVDDRQEEATVQAIASTSVTLLLSNAHSGTYPITVQGSEAIVRRTLRRCRQVAAQIDSAMFSAGIKKVDEVEFFPAGTQGGVFENLVSQQRYWRRELYRVLFGVGDPNLAGSGSGGNIGVY